MFQNNAELRLLRITRFLEKEKGFIVPLYKAIVRPHVLYTGMEAVSEEGHRHA